MGSDGIEGIKASQFQPVHIGPQPGFAGRSVLDVTGAKNATEKEKLTVLAKEFESILMSQMLKTMRSAIQKNELIKQGPGEEMFTEMLDEELARQMAFKSNDGLAASLVEQLLPVSAPSKVDKKQGDASDLP